MCSSDLHDAEDRATLAAAGIGSVAAAKDHRTGRDAMHARLAVQGDGKPRIFWCEGATVETDQDLYAAKKPTSTVAEFDSFVYPKGQDGKADREEPVKQYDDGLDAARYAVMYLDGPRSSQGAWIGSSVSVGTLPPSELTEPARSWA